MCFVYRKNWFMKCEIETCWFFSIRAEITGCTEIMATSTIHFKRLRLLILKICYDFEKKFNWNELRFLKTIIYTKHFNMLIDTMLYWQKRADNLSLKQKHWEWNMTVRDKRGTLKATDLQSGNSDTICAFCRLGWTILKDIKYRLIQWLRFAQLVLNWSWWSCADLH